MAEVSKTYTLRLCMTGLDAFELKAVAGMIAELKTFALMRKVKALAHPNADPVMQEAFLLAYDQDAARADRIRAALSSVEESTVVPWAEGLVDAVGEALGVDTASHVVETGQFDAAVEAVAAAWNQREVADG
jgi:hypothetical protein